MVSDGEANFVYFSDLLARRFPSVYEGLEGILDEHGVGFGIVQGTKDIWIRDYAPIQVGQDGSFVAFRYLPDYLRHRHRHLITDARKIIRAIPMVLSCEFSDIILDGGNVVRHRDKAIVTDKVYRENPNVGRDQLREELRRLLRVETLIVIPTEPGDVVGHADGVVRFVDEGRVMVNDYRNVDPIYRAALLKTLLKAGMDVAETPYRPWTGRSRGIPPAFGCYLNFLQVRDLIILPTYGYPEDRAAYDSIASSFPDAEVLTLDARELSSEGGVYNCVSWTMVTVKGLEPGVVLGHPR